MVICFKILVFLISVNVFGLLLFLFVVGFIMIIISIHIIIIITTIIMVISFYTHDQYNDPNNYQIITYSFKHYLLAEQ